MSETFQTNHQLQIVVLTVSDTRTKKTDTGGQLVQRIAKDNEWVIVDYAIVADDIGAIRAQISDWLERDEIDAIITTGGTGIAKRDVTLEAVQPLFEKEISGFGELFRYVSFTEDIGTKALLSRAAAGVVNEKVIFVLPGSRGAVKLAMERLILPEIYHIYTELTKHQERT